MKIKIKDNKVEFDCGCSFDVVSLGPPIRIKVDVDANKIPHTCRRTWELIGEGNTKGVFQLETRFGQQFSKKLKPDNMEQLAALSAILRPGCLNAIRDDKSVTEHYIDRKNGIEEVDYFHPDLEPILGATFGEMIYQEQAMQIAQHFAGFDLQQADVLRKAIGKKKADIMAKVKKDFVEGCEAQKILNKEQTEELFSWIEKSQRYSFNKSHAVSYAINSYLSAYLKAHFPVSFFTSYLYYAKDKQKPFDEVKLLISNANIMNIDVLPPSFVRDNKHFQRSGDTKKIYFGFVDIKGIGESAMNKIMAAFYVAEQSIGKPRKDWGWLETLIFFSQEVTSTTIKGFIESGAFDSFGISRTKMLFDFEQYSKLTKKEQAWIKQNLFHRIESGEISELDKLLSEALAFPGKGMCANKNRVQKVEDINQCLLKSSYSMRDSIDWIAMVEEARLGVPITASVVDSCKNTDQANCTVLDFIKHKEKDSGIFIACHIDEIKTHIPRNKVDEMAFVVVSDGNASLDCVIFADNWDSIGKSGLCFENNKILMSGDRSRTSDSFIIKKMWQLT